MIVGKASHFRRVEISAFSGLSDIFMDHFLGPPTSLLSQDHEKDFSLQLKWK